MQYNLLGQADLIKIHSKLTVAISVMAASAIANIVKSSLGPVGLDKMLVDDVGVSYTHTNISTKHRI